MANVQVLDVSHRKSEPNGFRIFRESGQNAILFLHFLTPMSVIIDDRLTNLARNACLIYTPGISQDYGAATETDRFENNYVTFRTATVNFLSRFEVILNEPFYINNEDDITRCIEWITWASANRMQSWEKEIEERVFELFRLIERGMVGISPKDFRDIQTKQRFIVLRGEMKLAPGEWTVEKMADTCYLSRSRFYTLYKTFFGISPSDDLAVALLSYAKKRLTDTGDSISAISTDMGYKRVESFIRMFCEKEGVTPGAYRKRIGVK
ncbi:MAG: AraC family transcriptional regulator [Oscillospiraceae bacterium]|nr:AraC family transcriptional regulator [Oscillospiraceae bacterium]